MQRAGFFACHARGLRLHNVEVTDHLGPAIVLTSVQDVEISDLLSLVKSYPSFFNNVS